MSDQPASYTASRSAARPSPAECVAIGGHCWEVERWEGAVVIHRTCKHCGLKQVGRTQDAVRWEDADA